MNSDFLKIISIIADFITLLTLITVIPFAFFNKNKSILAFKVGNFLHYLFRLALILLAIIIVYNLSVFIYYFLLLTFKGQIDNENALWEKEEAFAHISAYFISGAFGLSILWMLSSLIWTSSLNTSKEFLNLFLPKNKLFIKQEPVLEILNATYKTNSAELEVTQILRGMIQNNKLTITANNEIAGDPHPGVPKTLVIKYRIGLENYSIEIKEGDTLTIPASKNTTTTN